MLGVNPGIVSCKSQTPGWVLPDAVVDLRFDGQRYWFDGEEVAFPAATTRAANGWAFDGSGTLQTFAADTPRSLAGKGLLVEEARTNLFLNSDTPVTQTIAVSNSTEMTVSLWGSGSATLTGAMAGVVTEGSPLTATTSTTSLEVAVTGTPDIINVEAGGFGTSPIITGASAVSRPADMITLSDTSWLEDDMSWLIEWQSMAVSTGAERPLFTPNSGSGVDRIQIGITGTDTLLAAASIGGVWGGGIYFGTSSDDGGHHKFAVTYDQSAGDYIGSLDGATAQSVTGQTILAASLISQINIGSEPYNVFTNGNLLRLAALPGFRSAAEMEALAT